MFTFSRYPPTRSQMSPILFLYNAWRRTYVYGSFFLSLPEVWFLSACFLLSFTPFFAYAVFLETAELWGWYARFLNNAPALFFSPSLLASALEVSGCLALQYFPIQFRKILTSSILQHTLPLYRQLQTK